MKVIIPAAGIGKRLQPHTLTTPKPLLKVGGKPILEYLLKPVEELQPDEVIFVVGYKAEMIEKYVRENFSFKSTFIQQDKLLGLGYAVSMALDNVENDEVLIILSDTIVVCDLKQFVNTGDYVLGLHKVDNPSRFGIAEIQDGKIVSLEEKPAEAKGDMALIGLYYFSESNCLKTELSKLVESGKKTCGEIQLTDALAAMVDQGIKFAPSEIKNWYDCGKKETLLNTNRYLLKNQSDTIEIEGSNIIPPVYIAENVKVDNSTIGPYVAVDKNSKIVDSIISNSIIGEGVSIFQSDFEDSIIGSYSKVVNAKKNVLNIGEATEVIKDNLKEK